MKRLRSKQGERSARLLIIAFVSTIFLTGAGLSPRMDERHDTRQHFILLDSEIQAIKEEILKINRDILSLEESSLYPHGQQLVVLVSVANDRPVNPESIALHLDGRSVSHHYYTGSESAALQGGGVHRLYTGKLSEGKHRLDVSVIGTKMKGRTYKQQRSITITKAPGPKYLEIHLDPGDDGSAPGLTIHER